MDKSSLGNDWEFNQNGKIIINNFVEIIKELDTKNLNGLNNYICKNQESFLKKLNYLKLNKYMSLFQKNI